MRNVFFICLLWLDVQNFNLELSLHKVLPRELTQLQNKSILWIMDRLRMDPALIDKLVTIRMNKSFMEFVQKNIYKGDSMLIPGFNDKIDEVDNLWT